MRLSEAAVALLEIKKAFNVMILMIFIGFMRMSFLVLSKKLRLFSKRKLVDFEVKSG